MVKTQDQQNIQAKQKAVLALNDVYVNPAAVVSFHSKGTVLIIANSIEQSAKIIEKIADKFNIYYLLDTDNKPIKDNVMYGGITKVGGYLGSFKLEALIDNKPTSLHPGDKESLFDVVINLLQVDELEIAPVAPFGYYAITESAVKTALFAEINTLVGILDKPKFFDLNTDICVHSRNKTQVCNRCLNACEAQAISSNGDYVDINANLCHGCGNCVSVCPTGAVSYSYPSTADSAKKLYTLVGEYLSANGKQAKLLFHAQENSSMQQKIENTDATILPMAVEELGYLNLETFLYVFCLGVQSILIDCKNASEQTKNDLTKQIKLTTNILQSLGHQDKQPFIQLLSSVKDIIQTNLTPLSKTIGLLNVDNKRNRIFASVDFLYANQQTAKHPQQCDFLIEDDALFGEIIVDKSLCTLCMACTSVCPPKALSSGNIDKPIINFQESLCVQCGLCANSCPEDAIKLNSRLLYDNQQRTQPRILNTDEPFHCITCGKVFGSNGVVNKMMAQLKNHSMFTQGKLENLKMCEDCRVKALFE